MKPQDKLHAVKIVSRLYKHGYVFLNPDDYKDILAADPNWKSIGAMICVSIRVAPETISCNAYQCEISSDPEETVRMEMFMTLNDPPFQTVTQEDIEWARKNIKV